MTYNIKEIFENNEIIQNLIDSYNKQIEHYPTCKGSYIEFPEDKEGWSLRFPVYTYPRTGRITLEMIEENEHQKQIEQITTEACKQLLDIIKIDEYLLPIIRQPIHYRYWQDNETLDVYLSFYFRASFIPINFKDSEALDKLSQLRSSEASKHTGASINNVN